jgi:hypothetical protein
VKPIVTFKDAHGTPHADSVAWLSGVKNHPRGLLGELVRTSTVLRVSFEDGIAVEIETLNTIYRKESE